MLPGCGGGGEECVQQMREREGQVGEKPVPHRLQLKKRHGILF